MVHLRKDGRKFPSPHLIESFGDQKAPKIGIKDTDWIIILVFIHLDDFRLGKVEELSHKNIFNDASKFDKFGSKTF